MPPFLGCQCWYSFDHKTPSLHAKAILTGCVYMVIFLNFERMYPLFDVLCSDKIGNC